MPIPVLEGARNALNLVEQNGPGIELFLASVALGLASISLKKRKTNRFPDESSWHIDDLKEIDGKHVLHLSRLVLRTQKERRTLIDGIPIPEWKEGVESGQK